MKSNIDRELQFSEEANADYISILHYTAENWGVKQADRYLQKFEAAFQTLAHNPSIGRVAAFASGLRLFSVERHVLIYKVDADRILVLRILFAGMDPQIYL